MRILFITQVVDSKDPYLSFVTRWISAFSNAFEKVTVICLKEGEHELPANLTVLSLGKEKLKGQNSKVKKISYIFNFYKYLWRERKNYDAVFVHMNQEYVILAGLWWKLTGKRVYMWRNHYAGSFLTGIAAAFCEKVFCTSKYSYTARYQKTVLMPVGIDTDFFRPVQGVSRAPRSILFFGRLAPSKRPDVLMEALGIMLKNGVDFTAGFIGTALPNDAEYANKLKDRARELGLVGEHTRVFFRDGVPNDETLEIYSGHDVYVNLGRAGMLDKTIFEAMACGCVTLSAAADLRGKVADDFLFEKATAGEIAEKLTRAVSLSPEARTRVAADMRSLAETESLAALVEKAAAEMR